MERFFRSLVKKLFHGIGVGNAPTRWFEAEFCISLSFWCGFEMERFFRSVEKKLFLGN